MPLGSELRPRMSIRVEGSLYHVVTADYHGGGGKMGGVTHAKLRNVETGAVRERRFRADETVELVELERRTMQFIYADDSLSHFMDVDTFEQVSIENERLGRAAGFLREEMTIPVEFWEGRPLSIVLPDVVEARVAETAPAAHTHGSDNVWKEARLDNGVTARVPPFIATGEQIRVDVEKLIYVERAKEKRR